MGLDTGFENVITLLYDMMVWISMYVMLIVLHMFLGSAF